MKDEQLNVINDYTLAISEDFVNIEEHKVKLFKTKGWSNKINLHTVYITKLVENGIKKVFPQYDKVDGTSNTWICKPSYNARGHGIFCFNKREEVLQRFCKNAPAPKVVQKYIERPLLIKGQKFDIR